MGQKISQIAYNEEFEDLQTQGLSKTQVSLIQEHFYALCESANRPDKTINASMLSQLLKIPKKEAKIVIEFADIDGDGKLNDYDFVCLVGLFTKGTIQDKLEGVFYLFDEDYSQLMSENELENLIRCVICINENRIDIDQNLVKQKKEEILSVLFCDENELKISDFLTIAKEDQEFQTAFKKLGIFQETDLDFDYNEDLEEEFKKGEDEFRNENYDNIKNGLEVVREGMFETQQVQADEFMAVKPFLGTVRNSVPSNFDESQMNLNEPNSNLNLEFVHGYRCFDTRNNIYYIDQDNILFHSAAVGITMDINQHNQKFNFGNSDDIISIAKYDDIVATGQIGHKPIINLWSASTQESYSVIIGELQKGIAHLAISNDGKYLAGTAMNDEHDIAIYDISNIRQPVLVNKSKGVRDVVLNLQFSKDGKQLIMASKKELYFANISNKKIRINKATGWSKQKPMCLVVAFLQKMECVVGLNNGNIAVVKGTSVQKQVKAHKGCVYAMKNNKDMTKLFTGGADGKVIVFDANLTPLKEIIINTNGFKSINPKVRALDFCEDQKKLLIGTRGGEIIEHEIQSQQQRFVLQGHFSKELWGLAVNPVKQEYVTVGEDFLLAKWCIQQRKNILVKKLKFEANTLTVSPQGTQIAIGCKNGYLLVLNYSNFQQLKCKRVSKKELTQVKYSPCGKYLAAGSRDSKIYIFETSAKFKRISICKGHHSTITHLDFSEDSSVLQSNCTSYEILYWNIKNGKQDTRGASNNRDENWASWTCVLGWPVQGIFPPCSDGTDINSVDRTKDLKVLATGDDFGNVKLFKYPNFKGSSYQKFIGHSSHVTNVRFSSCQNYLISVGGNDKSVFQWQYIDNENEGDYEEEYEQDDDEDYLQMPIEDEQDNQNLGMFELEEEEAVEFMASKPWIGDLQNSIPSDFKYRKGMEDAPTETLKLHYINGYRCFDTRYAARIQNSEKVVFISAALGVQMNHINNTQTFFNEHEEDLVSFDLHPNREIAVSGQMAMKGKSKLIDIFVWDVNTKEVLSNLTGFHLRAIQLLKFSPSGETLYSFGKDDDNSLAVYDWKNQRLLATSKVDKKNVLDISFVSENEFLTVGSKHIKMWKLNGTRVQGSKLSWKGGCKPQAVLCCQGIPKFGYVIGTIKGKLIPVRGGMGVPLQAHQGKIYVLHYNEVNNTLFSGGEDGIVKQYSFKGGLKEIQTVVSINTNESFLPKIRAIDIHEDQLLIGTGASELFIIDQYENNNNKKKILTGHYQGELWGLSCHPSTDQFVTCGDDYTIRIWSASQRKELTSVKLQEKLRGICYSNNGELIACATYTGKIYLFDNNLKQLSTLQSSFTKKNQWIEDIKFSPDDQYLAFGAHGGASKLQILKLSSSNTLKKYGLVNAGLTSALLHLDWSSDSSQIVVNSQAYELKFVDIFSKKQIRASSVKDQDWSTWTCKLGFPVQGIFPGVDGTDVNTVDRAKSKTFLATGDDFQLVKLFKYPSVQPKSSYNSYKGHASHVTRVRFLQDDKYLISTGGNDKTSIIWKVIKEDDLEEDDEDEDFENEFVQKKVQKDKYGYEQNEEVEDDYQQNEMIGGFQIEHVEETEFMAVKPWLGAIKAPSDFVSPEPDQNEKPNLQVELEYVYGYRSKDCRNNLYLVQDNLYYNAAALGICLNYQSNTQKHFNIHRDDVISMDYDPNQGLFATGELGPKPWICIWDQSSMQMVFKLKEGIIKGVQALKFSPDGSKLAAVCIDDNHMVVVFDVQQQKMIANEKGDTAKIVDIEWLNDNEFVTSGIRHFKSWKFNNNRLKGSRGSFKKGASDKIVFCKLINNKVLCGAFKGELQMWNGGSCSKTIKLGKGSVDAICAGQSGLIYVGGKQKKIFILDQSLRKQSEVDLCKFLFQAMSLQIRSIQVNEDETELFIGTYSSQIFKISGQNSEKITEFSELENLQVEELMTGHYARNLKWTNEIWGLYPLMDETFLTVSDDAILRMWDKQQRKSIKYLELNIDKKGSKLVKDKVTKDLQDQAKLRSVAVSYDQKYAAVGCKEGTVRIINLKKWKQVKVLKKRKRWIQTLRFSPDDTRLAVGSHDCYIDIYDVTQNFKILHKMKKHSSFITHLDWSNDSQFLHSTCGAYELLFWDASSGKQITRGASALRDEDWATWSCVLGWPVQGVFKPEWDGSDVNMIDRSNKETRDGYRVIACADDFSEIRLYKYPCLDKVTQGIRLRGHSSHVTNVKFDKDDQYLFSAGGEDQCVMQWKIL